MQKTREVRLDEILIAIIKKWKLLVILALLFAIILGGLNFTKLNNTIIDGTMVPLDASMLSYEEYLQQIDYYTDKIDFYSKRADGAYRHVQESYALTIDPYNCAVSSRTCIFYGDPAYTEAAAAAMVTVIKNIDCATCGIARDTELEDMDGQYIDELITVTTPIDSVPTDAPRFTVSVVAKDKFTAEKILGNLIACVDTQYPTTVEFAKSAASLGWEYSPAISKICYNSNLLKLQNDLINNANSMSDTLAKNEAALNDIKKTYAPYYNNGGKLPETQRVSVASAAKASVKYAIFGLLAGLILGVIIAFCQVLISPTLYNSRQLQDEANIKYIGSIENTDSLKGMKKALKKVAGDKNILTPSLERTAYTAAKLSSLAKDGKILVTGTACSEDMDKAIALLKEAEPSLNLVFKGNLTVSAAAVKELSDAAGILIMEQAGKSKIKPLASLLEACRFTEKDVIGYVMI